MSSISLPMEKQIRHFFPFTAIATETTPETFIESASIGEIQLFETNVSGVMDPAFYLLKKELDGKVIKTDLVRSKNVTYLKGTAPRAKVGKSQTFTLATVEPKAVYNLSLKINYNTSEKNFMYVSASVKATATDTPTTLLTKLAKELGDNLASSIHTNTNISGIDTVIAGTTVKKNKYFTITQVAGALTITEKDWILDGFAAGLKTFDQLMWNAEIITASDLAKDGITKTATAPVFATGQGYQMVELERYLVAHRGAEFGFPDVTTAFAREFETKVTEEYYAIDMKYFDVSRNDSYQSDKMIIFVSSELEAINALGVLIAAKVENAVWVPLT